jgi:hypothetical protein
MIFDPYFFSVPLGAHVLKTKSSKEWIGLLKVLVERKEG